MSRRGDDGAMPPNWGSDKFVVGKLTRRKARALHRWRLANEPGYAAMVEENRARHDLIMKARRRGLIEWAYDPEHYRGGAPYCKCGTVEAHNARHDEVLRQVDDGR